ncbi:MAG: DNA/RNA nuclease SfsA [Clostridia bacterium]|nr:DNA/RNA nuclease SfsA [Clostridia bacterium]
MLYNNIRKCKFISRPNRFIANVDINGIIEVCHVKNTGRCKELLTEGAEIFVQESDKSERKTKYDLISVVKDGKIVNIDSQAPNKVFFEWIEKSGYFGDIKLIKPESKYNESRFDFYIETSERKIFVEVKGVTLEENGIVKFPDAPTERGIKHLKGLCDCTSEGYEAFIFFVVQMENVKHFEPNRKTYNEFANWLLYASKHGVEIRCVSCEVTPDSMCIDRFVEVRLD